MTLKEWRWSRLSSFGGEHLCKQIVDRLELDKGFKRLGFSKHEATRAAVSIAGRALFAASEHKTAQILGMNSSLKERFGYDKPLDHRELYAAADQLYDHKDAIDGFLHQRISSLFDLEDKLVIFDISNTYFETRKSEQQAGPLWQKQGETLGLSAGGLYRGYQR